MRRWGIRKKVLVVTLIPTLLTTLMLGMFFTYSWVNNIESLLKDRGESLSRQLAAGSEYGLFTANPFALKEVAREKQPSNVRLAPGESITLKHRILLHEGDEKAADIANAWKRYTEHPEAP